MFSHMSLQLCYQILRRCHSIRSFSQTMSSRQKSIIGLCQLNCTADTNANYETCSRLVREAKDKGAEMVFLPEACDFIAESRQQSVELSESIDGKTVTDYRKLAEELNVWLSIGSFHEKGPPDDADRCRNTQLLIDNNGTIRGSYNKVHLFEADIPNKVRLRETDVSIPGNRVVPPIVTPVGNIGMMTCYDIRFPEMSIALRQQGADILIYPSAFTVPTGKAHWEVLLRNKAIENQCYVVAAAQTGKHNDKRISYGHSMVVDPWGKIIAEIPEDVGVCTAEIDKTLIDKVRLELPVSRNTRNDLYSPVQVLSYESIDTQESYRFGHCTITSDQVFYKTSQTIAFVNIKPVLPGHVLLAPITVKEKFSDLTPSEVADLFIAAQRVTKVMDDIHNTKSSTIVIQDGPDAGQSVKHVHVHILPRHPGDFTNNDDIYNELANHDNDLTSGKLRTREEMAQEATDLRKYFL